jgi:hypothetical protein
MRYLLTEHFGFPNDCVLILTGMYCISNPRIYPTSNDLCFSQ